MKQGSRTGTRLKRVDTARPLTLAISLGDVTGIGPEITLKALAARTRRDRGCYVLIGDAQHLQKLNERLRLPLSFREYQGSPEPGGCLVLNAVDRPLNARLTPGAAEAARAAYEWVKLGAERCLRGEFDGLITAPVNKEAIIRAGIPFVGQTELLSELSGTGRTAMMLLGQDDRGRWLRVALATTHLPIRDVSRRLEKRKIVEVIELAAKACRELGLPRARVGVCGLNPHAGEGGHLGNEEIETVAPAVKQARRRGVDAAGPLSADALFYYAYQGQYDAVVAMYHDQGLAPLKMVAFEHGVNWTLGLPFVRTSPDHGTAYDIAGKGVARESSMIAAIDLARSVAAR